MASKVTIDRLASEVKKILDDYGDEVSQNIGQITRRIGQKGAQVLKNESRSSFPVPTSKRPSTEKYAKGWTYKVQEGRLYTTVTIYNRRPGMPHLLEHGHVIKTGGRVTGKFNGKEHIAPVEEKLIDQYEREVKSKL